MSPDELYYRYEPEVIDLDDVVEVCRDLPAEHVEFIEDCDEIGEVIDYLLMALPEMGIDADEFLELRGITE